MRSIRSLFILTEDLVRGRKFAKKGHGYDALNADQRQRLVDDLADYYGYFDEMDDQGNSKVDVEKEIKRDFAFFEEGGKVHAVIKEPGSGYELESVWDDGKKEWDHLPAEAEPRDVSGVDIFGDDDSPAPAPGKQLPHREPKADKPEKQSIRVPPTDKKRRPARY